MQYFTIICGREGGRARAMSQSHHSIIVQLIMRNGGDYMKNAIRTSKPVAKKAGKAMKSPDKVKRSLAGSALVNRKKKP